MDMSSIRHKVKSLMRHIAASLIAIGCLTSCDSFIYDDQGDCSVHYRVSFRYIKNVLGADAFGPQVTDINLYVFDQQGRLVLHKSQSREKTVENDYFMEVDLLPGKYDLLAWCEGASLNPDATHFTIGGGAQPTAIYDLDATLSLQSAEDALYSDKDITALFHGMAENVDFPDTFGTVDIAPVYLTKDTNHLTVLLQNVDGYPMDKDLFKVELAAANSELTWANDVVGTPEFNYLPWSVESTYSSFDWNTPEPDEPDPEPGTETRATLEDEEIPSGVLTELTTGRLMADREQYLHVSNAETGETILRIPLIQYLKMVKGKYPGISGDQDYLDAHDDYSLVFFIGEGMTWVKSRIYINGWRIVPPQDIEI